MLGAVEEQSQLSSIWCGLLLFLLDGRLCREVVLDGAWLGEERVDVAHFDGQHAEDRSDDSAGLSGVDRETGEEDAWVRRDYAR